MSLYCTLPRRHHRGPLSYHPHQRLHLDLVSSTFLDSTSLTSESTQSIFVQNPRTRVSLQVPSESPNHSIADWQSFVAPTEASDTVTFTESVTSTFDDYASKVYVATDTLTSDRSSHGRKLPNFYGEVDDEDDDDEYADEHNAEPPGELFGSDLFRADDLGPQHGGGRSVSSRCSGTLRSRYSWRSLSMRLTPGRMSRAPPPSHRPPTCSLFDSTVCPPPNHSSRNHHYHPLKLLKVFCKSKLELLLSNSQQHARRRGSLCDALYAKPKAAPWTRLERVFSFSRLSMRECKRPCFEHVATATTTTTTTAKTTIATLNGSDQWNERSDPSPLTRFPTIIKKRPLSMTYDLGRFDSGTARHKRDNCDRPSCADHTPKAHMVAAFEQSLSSMTTRLQHLSSSSELKDCELDRLRKTIETLKRQGGSLVGVAKQAAAASSRAGSHETKPEQFQRHLSSESVNSVSSCGDSSLSPSKSKKKSKLKLSGNNTSWIRSSFSRAFKKNKPGKRDASSDAELTTGQSGTDVDDPGSAPGSPLLSTRSKLMAEGRADEQEDLREMRKQLREKEMQLTDMRLESLTSAHQVENLKEMVSQMRVEMMNLKQDNDRLQRLVSHKSLASSQSSMTSAIGSSIPSGGSSSSGGTTSGSAVGPPVTVTSVEDSNSLESVEMDSPSQHAALNDGHRLVTLGSGSHVLATLAIMPKTNWDQLDLLIKKSFKEHLIRVDPNLSLGITVDSLACYRVGAEKIQRNLYQQVKLSDHIPELLPFGYLVPEAHINVQFKSALDSLVFDTLTPKSVLNHFLSLLLETRRLILSGPSGTGKTFLAHKLAEYLSIKTIAMDGAPSGAMSPRGTPIGDRCCPTGAIATFQVDHKNSKELRAYLVNIAEQCELDVVLSAHLPAVIILDNLHHSVDSLADILNDLHKIPQAKSPFIIGTINQSVISQTSLFQSYHFRFVQLSISVEPVKGFLNRFLRRKWLEAEARHALNGQKFNSDIVKVIDWVSKVCVHLNNFLEGYFRENISIGPRLFTSCPIDCNGSQSWFTDLWNFSILPFIIENLREYSRQHEKLTSVTDPTEWIVESYPWTLNSEWSDHLNRLRLEDIDDDGEAAGIGTSSSSSLHQTEFDPNNNTSTAGLESNGIDQIKDPFLRMLLKLKEASEYSSQDSTPTTDHLLHHHPTKA